MALNTTQKLLAGIWLKGDEEILAKLLSFTSPEFKTAVTFAVKKNEGIALKDARARAARIGDHGNLAKSLIEKVKQQGRSGAVIAIVGADAAYKSVRKRDTAANRQRVEYQKMNKIAHLIERGTKPHEINATAVGGHTRGKSAWGNYKAGKGQETAGHLLAVPVGGGQFRYVTKVNHPGAKPQSFLVPAQDLNKGRILAGFEADLKAKVERMWSKSHGLS
jgi:hypothetical protein